jgi:hypothetical protein
VLSPAAYGFRLAGGPEGGWLAVRGAERWPLLTLERDADVSLREEARVDWGRFHAAISPELAEDQILHPLLGRMLVFLAGPRGVDALHGGVLAGPDGAWAVTGPKEAGKSTLLAQCARNGACVLSDDVVVLDGTRCLAGPRCIDLREESVARLGPGVPVRQATRRRVMLPPAPAEEELAGVVYLAWGPRCELVPLPPSDRLARLVARRTEEHWPRDPSLLLELATRPAFELRRPKTLSSLEPAASLLMEELGLAFTPPAPARARTVRARS